MYSFKFWIFQTTHILFTNRYFFKFDWVSFDYDKKGHFSGTMSSLTHGMKRFSMLFRDCLDTSATIGPDHSRQSNKMTPTSRVYGLKLWLFSNHHLGLFASRNTFIKYPKISLGDELLQQTVFLTQWMNPVGTCNLCLEVNREVLRGQRVAQESCNFRANCLLAYIEAYSLSKIQDSTLYYSHEKITRTL